MRPIENCQHISIKHRKAKRGFSVLTRAPKTLSRAVLTRSVRMCLMKVERAWPMSSISIKSFARLPVCPRLLPQDFVAGNFCIVGSPRAGLRSLWSNFFRILNRRSLSPKEKKNYYNPDDRVIQTPDALMDPHVLGLQNSIGMDLNGFCVIYKESWIEESAIRSNSYIVFVENRGHYTAKVTEASL